MSTIHAILAIRQPLYRELVGTMLADEIDVRIHAEVDSELEIATALQRLLEQDEYSVDDLVVVITSVDDGSDVPAACSRLLMEFPEITIVGVSAARIYSYRVCINTRNFRCSQKGLLKAIRETIRDTNL